MLSGTSGDHLLRSTWSKQDQLEQITHSCVQLGFDCLQGWRQVVDNLTGQLGSVFDQSHSKEYVLC